MEMGIEFLDLIKRQLPHATDEELDNFEDQVRVLREDLQEYEEDSAEFAEALDARISKKMVRQRGTNKDLTKDARVPVASARKHHQDPPPTMHRPTKIQSINEPRSAAIISVWWTTAASIARPTLATAANTVARINNAWLPMHHTCKAWSPLQEARRSTIQATMRASRVRQHRPIEGTLPPHNPGIPKCQRCHIVRPKYSSRKCSRCYGPRISAAETLFRPLITTTYPSAILNRRLTGALRPDDVVHSMGRSALY